MTDETVGGKPGVANNDVMWQAGRNAGETIDSGEMRRARMT